MAVSLLILSLSLLYSLSMIMEPATSGKRAYLMDTWSRAHTGLREPTEVPEPKATPPVRGRAGLLVQVCPQSLCSFQEAELPFLRTDG